MVRVLTWLQERSARPFSRASDALLRRPRTPWAQQHSRTDGDLRYVLKSATDSPGLATLARAIRQRARVKGLRIVVLTTPLFLLALQTNAMAFELGLNSPQRVEFLRTATELAEQIVIATVIDTAYVFPDELMIWTRYTARVDQQLKGPVPPDSLVTLVEPGGRTPTRAVSASPSYHLAIGQQYLLFLAFCATDNEWRVICPSCTARVVNQVAFTRNPRAQVPLSSLVDSVGMFLQPCSLPNQRAGADLIVTGSLVTVSDGDPSRLPVFSNSVLNFTTEEVLREVQGPTVTPGDPIVVTARAVLGANAIAGTKPTLSPGNSYLLFLQHTDGGWALRNSAYAAWRKDGSVGLVEAWCFPCPHVVETENWDDLIAAASQ